jgi:hypothetical protein
LFYGNKIFCQNKKLLNAGGLKLEMKQPRSIAKKWILKELKEHGKLTKRELLELTEIKESTMNSYLSQLIKEELVESVRVSGKETVFYLKEN